MKLLCTIILAILCATASAQTIRTLGYNSTNGQIVTATNVVWTNAFSFSTNAVAAQVRTNLGLGQDDDVMFDAIRFDSSISDATNFNDLGIRATASAFGGFYATYDGAYKFAFAAGNNSNALSDVVRFRVNTVDVLKPLTFDIVNSGPQTRANLGFSTNLNTLWTATNAATARTNLSLGLPALTNTNNANFISALGVLATNGNAAGLTNFPTVATASNVTGVVALTNGGSGASNAQTARSNFFGHGGISTNISVVGTNNTNTLVFTNGLLMEVQ